MGLRRSLLSAVLADLPTPDSALTEPSERWDWLLGGRTGPNSWNQYGRGAGTTCIIALNGWMRAAGFPDEAVVVEPTPQGGGTKMITKVNAWARAMGWFRTPERGVLPDFRPGDIYEINRVRDDGADGTHVGVVVRVTPSADGQSLEVETADGGQGPLDKQSATRSVRTFSLSDGPHAIRVKSPFNEGWLDRWIRVGGDEADVESFPAVIAQGGGGWALAAGVAGIGLLLAGFGLYVAQHSNATAGLMSLRGREIELIVYFDAKHGDTRDFDQRRVFERVLNEEGFESTGAATDFDDTGRVSGTEISVKTSRAWSDAKSKIRSLARQYNMRVRDIVEITS